MLLKINKLFLMTEVYSNTYKTDCLQAGILLTKKGVVCFFQDSLTWNKDHTISISLSRGGGIIWLFCKKNGDKNNYFSSALVGKQYNLQHWLKHNQEVSSWDDLKTGKWKTVFNFRMVISQLNASRENHSIKNVYSFRPTVLLKWDMTIL